MIVLVVIVVVVVGVRCGARCRRWRTRRSTNCACPFAVIELLAPVEVDSQRAADGACTVTYDARIPDLGRLASSVVHLEAVDGALVGGWLKFAVLHPVAINRVLDNVTGLLAARGRGDAGIGTLRCIECAANKRTDLLNRMPLTMRARAQARTWVRERRASLKAQIVRSDAVPRWAICCSEEVARCDTLVPDLAATAFARAKSDIELGAYRHTSSLDLVAVLREWWLRTLINRIRLVAPLQTNVPLSIPVAL